MLALSDKSDTTPACGDLDDGFSPVAAYEYVESFLKQNGDPAPQTPDGCVVLPLSLVLSLLPSEVLGDDAAAAAADGESVSIEVPDLYAQLAAGRVAISATALAYHVPAHLLRHEAFEEHGDEIVLPLRHVVDAVGFASLRRHCAVKRRRYANIDRLENPFKEATLSEVSVTSEPAVEQPVSDPISVDEPVSQDLAEDRPGMAVSAPQPSASEEPAEEEPVAVEPVERRPLSSNHKLTKSLQKSRWPACRRPHRLLTWCWIPPHRRQVRASRRLRLPLIWLTSSSRYWGTSI